MNPVLKSHLQIKLRQELSESCRMAAIANWMLIILYQAPFYNILKYNTANWVIVSMLALSYSARFFLAQFKKIKNESWLWAHSALMLLHALCWSALLVNISLNYSHKYEELIVFTYIVFSGLVASASYTVAISRRDFFYFVTPILFAQLAVLFFSYYESGFQIFASCAIALAFLLLVFQRKKNQRIWTEQRALNFELQNIIDAIPGGITVVRSGVYFMINKYGRSLISESSEIIGTEALFNSEQETKYTEKMALFANSDKKSIQYEASFNVMGRLHTHLVTAVKTIDDDIIISTINIHELKEIEAEVFQQKIKLEQSAKMAALGELAGDLVHEINNPMTIISLRAQQLLLQSKKDTLTKEILCVGLENIYGTTQRIDKIIKGLHSLSQDIDSEVYIFSNLKDIVDEALAFCEIKFKDKDVVISRRIPDYLQLECRPLQISQVLLKLLNNSYEAVADAEKKVIEISAVQAENFIQITITDSGPGIQESLREKIMQPFFSTKKIGQGSGLGLSISKKIIEAHRGQLYFEYQNTQNTELVILLPITQNLNK